MRTNSSDRKKRVLAELVRLNPFRFLYLITWTSEDWAKVCEKKEKVKLNDDKHVDMIKDIPKNRPNMIKEYGLILNKCNNLAICL